MNKVNYKALREAMADNLTVEQMIELFGLEVDDLLSLVDNEDLQDNLEDIEDYLPRFFDESRQ